MIACLNAPEDPRSRLETTLRADQSLDGLTPSVRYFFRYRGITSAGKGDWSQTVSMLVL